MTEKKTQKCSEGNTKLPRSMDSNDRLRNWCFTNFDLNSPINFCEKRMKYLLYGEETCPDTGNTHHQGFVVMKNGQTFKYMKKHVFNNNCHFEPCIGGFKSNFEYCTKDGNWQEFGKKPAQGERTDLANIVSDISEGFINIDDIVINKPLVYHQYGRTLERANDIILLNKWRQSMTKGIWLHGKTGCGKSKLAFTSYSPKTHYVVPEDKGWWDNYRQQKVVILNDFRGHISYNNMLQMVDMHPYDVSRRGRSPMPFISDLVIVTSSLRPEQVYHNRENEDKIEQLLRRFKVFNIESKVDNMLALGEILYELNR